VGKPLETRVDLDLWLQYVNEVRAPETLTELGTDLRLQVSEMNPVRDLDACHVHEERVRAFPLAFATAKSVQCVKANPPPFTTHFLFYFKKRSVLGLDPRDACISTPQNSNRYYKNSFYFILFCPFQLLFTLN